MPPFVEKYNDLQRDAMAMAFEDLKIRPAWRVVQLAKAGELELNGERLDPFVPNEESVRHYARLYRKRRAGLVSSKLAEAPHKDAKEAMRRRLVAGAEMLLRDWEKRAKRDMSKADPQRLSQIARAWADIDRLDPSPETRRPSKNVPDEAGRKGPSPSALAKQILGAARDQASSGGPYTTLNTTSTHGGEEGVAQYEQDAEQDDADGGPGSLAHAQQPAMSA